MLLWAASAAVCAGLFLAFYGVVQTAGAGRVRAVDLLLGREEEPGEYDEFRARLNDSFATRVVDALGGVSESLVRRLTPSVWHDKLANRLRMAGLEVTVHRRTIYVAKVLGAAFGLVLSAWLRSSPGCRRSVSSASRRSDCCSGSWRPPSFSTVGPRTGKRRSGARCRRRST